MTMSKSLMSCLGVKVSQLKVMCGLSLDSTAREERAVNAIVSDPIPSGKFLSVYRQRCKGKQLSMEFKALTRNQEDHTTNAALRNVLLNNKQEVVPYDHSRVIVWDRPESMRTDYYNASYIDGYNGPKEYIASQGPSTKCLVSFWHMVWQEGVTCIVMATGLFENAVQQCDKYWVDHARKYAQHGHISIWHERSIYLAQLNIRTFRIQKDGCAESRLLTHFEMVGFHDESPDPGLLLDIRRRVHTLSATQLGPVLVHCRCGGSRTAVYIAVDFCLHQLHSEDRVDVYNTVLHLRRFRKNMVRTLSQYKQIYNTVAMFLQCGLTVYPADTLPAAYHVHYAHAGDSKHQRLEKEFQTLQSIVPRLSIGDCASGHRVENRSKSRDIMMLPPECARPYMTTTDCGDGGTDFINAVYVDGYHTENSYLVTQWPMKKTIGDLWRLIFDFKISSIVFMNDPQKFSRSYPRFWPKEVNQIACYGPISVRYLSCERQASIVVRTFAIRKPKRHPHLVAQVLLRISEDVMMMNNLVGCELRPDETIVKMFQVLTAVQQSSDISHTDHSNSSNVHACHARSGTKDGESGRGQRKGLGIHSRSLLTLMEYVTDWQKRSNSRQPVCVISKDGSSRVGLYCAVAVCCDQFRVEREVDVFNSVRLVRRNRPQLVPNIEEYRYIYHFMTEYIILSGSKPDIIVCEPSSVVLPHSDSNRSTAIPPVMTNSVHGGVYVVTKGRSSDNFNLPKNYDNCMHNACELQPHSETIVSQFPCVSYHRHYQRTSSGGGKLTSGSIVPCRLDNQSRPCTLPGRHSKTSTHLFSDYDTHCPLTSSGDAPETSRVHLQCENNKSFNGKTVCTGSMLSYGQIFSYSTSQPLGDIHHSPSDFSIIKHLPQNQSPNLSHMNIPNSHSSIQISSPSPESASQALPSPSPFLTPEIYHNGKVFGGLRTTMTSSSLSPGSLCKSSSFFSCKSNLSVNSNFLGNGLFSNQNENGDAHVNNGIALPPESLNGHLTSTTTRLDKHSIHTGLSSSLSTLGLLHTDINTIKASQVNNDTSHATLKHASYASLDGSVASPSNDVRQIKCHLDWMGHDNQVIEDSKCKVKAHFPQLSTCVKVYTDLQPHGNERGIIKEKSTDMNKIPSSTFNQGQKFRGCMFKKQIMTSNPNPN